MEEMKKRTFENVESIEANILFHGSGIVNADSAENQKAFFQSYGIIKKDEYDNVTYAKKCINFLNDDVSFKYKVSSECIRHEIFKREMNFFNNSIMEIPNVFFNALASPALIARGYVFTKKKEQTDNGWSLKKDSIFAITDATADMPQIKTIPIEIHTKSGKKESSNETGEKDTSMYARENVGEYDYTSAMHINLHESQFISMDNIYSRCSVSFDKFDVKYKDVYFNALKRNFGLNEIPQVKNYYLGTATMGEEFAEEGIKLTKDMVNYLVHFLLQRTMEINIHRGSSGAYFEYKGMEITIKMEGGKSEKIVINSQEDLNALTFNYSDAYLEANPEQIRKRNEIMNKVAEEKKRNASAKRGSGSVKKVENDNE